MGVVGLITARGGSKGIPKKNIALCAGKPLLQYACESALASSSLDRVILSTDSDEIATVARRCGVEAPFMRPSALATDQAASIDVIRHALDWLRDFDGTPEAIVLLQPTSPLRTAGHIDEAVALFRSTGADAVVSVVEVPHRFHPRSLMKEVDGSLRPYNGDEVIARRQDLDPVYARNGPVVLVLSPKNIDAGRLYGGRVVGYVMNAIDSIDVDSPEDLLLAEHLLRAYRSAR